MARTTVAEVRLIFPDELSGVVDATVTAFISDANAYVTEILGSSGLSVATLTTIEKYLTGHTIAMTIDRQAQEEEVKDAKIKYTGKTDMGLEATYYGQMVLFYDTSGLIEENMNSKPITFFAVEKDSTSYNSRVI